VTWKRKNGKEEGKRRSKGSRLREERKEIGGIQE
jgi:hypothetical protein